MPSLSGFELLEIVKRNSKNFGEPKCASEKVRWINAFEIMSVYEDGVEFKSPILLKAGLTLDLGSQILSSIALSYGQVEFVGELWRTFLEICAKDLSRLEHALMTENRNTARDIAHSLRSASGNVGASGLYLICTTIEDVARTSATDFADLAALLISTYEERSPASPRAKSPDMNEPSVLRFDNLSA